MSHLGLDNLRRVLAGEMGPQETEQAADHLVSCAPCRAEAGTLLEELRAVGRGLRGEGPLQLVFGLIDRERQKGVESLAALAEWAELRTLSRRGQRDRVRMAKACHTMPFFHVLLGELKEAPSWEEAEFLAALALLSAEAMSQRGLIAQVSHHDLQAEVWTAVANARRRAAEWERAHKALAQAERHLKEGTGDRRLEAGLLSIVASTLADEGHVSQALAALETCRAIYENLSEWALLARTLVQTANVLEPAEPAKGLAALDRATPLIPAEDSYLTLLADLLRVECLLGVGKPSEALRVYRRCSPLLIANPRTRVRIRGKVTCARLLDALGLKQQAERLFNEVVDGDIENELYKDAFLDLLSLYGHHMKAGDADKAARVCRRALTDPSLSEIAHEQLRTLWSQLLEAAQHRAIGEDVLGEIRQYLSVHWKRPAGSPPKMRV